MAGIILTSLVAIIVVGPKDLPALIRSITKWFKTIKSIIWTFQDSLEEIARETELQKFRDEPKYFIEKSDGQVLVNKKADPANRNILPDN